MPIKVHVRGVGVIVADKDHKRVTEVLFPRADAEPPNGHQVEVKDPDGHIVGKVCKHADGTLANPHFSGALLVNADKSTVNILLMDRSVVPIGLGGGGATYEPDELIIPKLHEIIANTDPNKTLTLRSGRTAAEISTSFNIPTGSFTPSQPSLDEWVFYSKNGKDQEKRYFLEATWTIDAPSVEFAAHPLGGGQPTRFSVDHAVYFYNFDRPDPTEADLTADKDSNAGAKDNDFKWVYKVLKQNTSLYPTYKQWLDNDEFPAPTAFRTVSVSTCFEAIWTGGKER